jgi:HSP20 family protein
MVEKVQKASPMRSIWYIHEECQNLSSDPQRWRLSGRQHVWRPPTDLFETEDAVVVRVEVAEMQDGEFNISLDDRILSIRGVRADTCERRAYYQMEIPYGEFSTEVEIPVAVDADHVEAIYSDGFLRVVLPKTRPYEIHIEN